MAERMSTLSWVLFVLAFVIFYALFGMMGGNGLPLWQFLLDIGVWLVLILVSGLLCAALAGLFFLTNLPFTARVRHLLPASMLVITVFLILLRLFGEDPAGGAVGIPL